ncbi:MAG TPA: fibronectin type III domain-containing protein [Gemmatimonadaceae bacterium]
MHSRSWTFTGAAVAVTLVAVTLIGGAPAIGAQTRSLPPAPAPVQGPVLTRGANGSKLAAPPAPTGVSVTGTPASATIRWQPVPGVASYVVARKQTNAPVQQTKLVAAATRWNDNGLRPSTAYTYMVDAIYPDGREAYTEVPFTTPPAVNPSGFSAKQTGDGQVLLAWQSVTGASYYVVFGPGSSYGGVKVSVVKGTPFYKVSGAPAGLQTWAVASYYDPGPFSTSAPVSPNAASTAGTLFSNATLTVVAAPDAQATKLMQQLACAEAALEAMQNAATNLSGGAATSQTPCPPALASAPNTSGSAFAESTGRPLRGKLRHAGWISELPSGDDQYAPPSQVDGELTGRRASAAIARRSGRISPIATGSEAGVPIEK